MALFRNKKLQILSMNLLENQWRYGEIFDNYYPKSGRETSSRSLKYFWTSKQKPHEGTKTPCYATPLDNPLIMKGNTTRCLEDKKKKKVCKPQETFWEYLFGEQKTEPPDPNAFYKECCRDDDDELKLNDSRHLTAPGDIHLFTEYPKGGCTFSAEPQPKPPPIYKIPNAVTSSRIATAIGGHTCVHIPLPSKSDNCKKQCQEPEPFWIPYTEMKPKVRSKNPFTCESGKRAEDVSRPISKDKYSPGFPSFGSKTVEPDAEITKKFSSCPSSSEDESFVNNCKGRKKLSRTERLKILTVGREGVYKPLK